MVEIIETNLSIDNNNKIADHQSRIVLAESWNDYVKAYKQYNGKPVNFKCYEVSGSSIPSQVDIYQLKCDDFHLHCMFTNGIHNTARLAYLRHLNYT